MRTPGHIVGVGFDRAAMLRENVERDDVRRVARAQEGVDLDPPGDGCVHERGQRGNSDPAPDDGNAPGVRG
jgi:hypothetical protein